MGPADSAHFSRTRSSSSTRPARLVSDQANAIDANGGGTFTNAGTITGGNVGISLVGGDALVVNSGVIEGGANPAISSTGPFAVTITNTGRIASGGGLAV